MDALTIMVREGGHTVNVHVLVAAGVNADGGREVLGLDVASGEDGAGRLAFLETQIPTSSKTSGAGPHLHALTGSTNQASPDAERSHLRSAYPLDDEFIAGHRSDAV